MRMVHDVPEVWELWHCLASWCMFTEYLIIQIFFFVSIWVADELMVYRIFVFCQRWPTLLLCIILCLCLVVFADGWAVLAPLGA